MSENRLLIVFLIFCSLSISYGNSGGYQAYGAGGVLIPIKYDNIEMVTEVINIKVEPSSYYGSINTEYECIFTFRNLSDEPQKTLMGFPSENKIYWDTAPALDYYTPYDEGSSIENFKAFVDNKEVNTEIYLSGENIDLPGIESYGSVHSFNVEFKANQELIVINKFSIKSYCYFPQSMGAEVLYILKTGATWAAPIKDSIINITYDFPVEMTKITYPGNIPYIAEDNKAFYHFTDIIPDFDIRISIYWNLELDLDHTDFYSQLNEYLKSKDINRVLPVISFFESDFISGDCAKIIDPVTNEEKETLRHTLFDLGNHFYDKKDYIAAIRYFGLSFMYAKGNNRKSIYPNNILQEDLARWGVDPANKAPSYYSAYNMACCYSLELGRQIKEKNSCESKDVSAGIQWLLIAYRLNPDKIKELAETDADLKTIKTIANDQIYFLPN